MSLTDRLIARAKDYEQRAAHHRELSELGAENAVAELVVSEVFAGVAITLREIVQAVLEEHEARDEKDLAA